MDSDPEGKAKVLAMKIAAKYSKSTYKLSSFKKVASKKAAAELVKMCDNSDGKLILDRFLEFSPSIVWARLMKQSSLVDDDIKIQENKVCRICFDII